MKETPPDRDPLERDPPRQRHPSTEIPLDRDTPWTETPLDRAPLDTDPLWTETTLFTETPPGQRPHCTVESGL